MTNNSAFVIIVFYIIEILALCWSWEMGKDIYYFIAIVIVIYVIVIKRQEPKTLIKHLIS